MAGECGLPYLGWHRSATKKLPACGRFNEVAEWIEKEESYWYDEDSTYESDELSG